MNHAGRGPRVVFFGMTGLFSLAALGRLLARGADVCAVVVPAERASPPVEDLVPPPSRSPLPLASAQVRRSVVELGWERGLPVLAVGGVRHPAVRGAVARLGADVACVACFPWRVPPELLAAPRHGFLNAHPSLLPAHRGPSPLFWTLREGALDTGVTAHWMDSGFDTGPVAARAPVALPEGASWSEAERLLAEAAGELLADALEDLAAGRARREPQPAGQGSEPWPSDGDFALSAGWPARRAFIFMRGTAEWGRPYRLALPGAALSLDEALGYEPAGELGAPFARAGGGELLVQMAPGVLRARGRAAPPASGRG